MFASLPGTAQEFSHWAWPQIEPYYKDLTARKLDATNVESWMTDWSRLSRLLHETYQRHYVAITVDTTDKEAERAYQTFLDEIFPSAQAAEQKLKQMLLDSGLEPPGFEVPMRNLRTEAAIFHEENLPLLAEDLKLGAEYDRTLGAQTVIWDGEEVTLMQLQPLYQKRDRAVRERAWRLAAERQLADRETINALWVKQMALRRKLAANAGFSNYRDYRWKQLLRLDYTPEDSLRFHEAILAEAVPAAMRFYEQRRRQLGLDSVRPWDLSVDPKSRPALRPYTNIPELESKISTIFTRVDPKLGEYFDIMRRESLLDLENRKGKAPGGYCTEFVVAGRPFIFMNAVGLHDDVQTLLHEGGHAFHVFETTHLPYLQQLQVGMEFAEVASMAMELLASPYLAAAEGGFYSVEEAARARAEHLESAVLFWPYMAVVDGFQHWAYLNIDEASNPDNCDAKWAELWQRFMPGEDWSGLEQEMMTGWQRKLHIHTAPFYYVEYGMAQLGAMQVWRNALQDQAGAVAAYRKALSLGATVSLPKLYETAGARFAFDPDTLRSVISLAEETAAKQN